MKLGILALVLIGLVFGLIWCSQCAVFGLSLDLKIRPLEVVTLAISIFIAFFLQHFLASRATNFRAEKDLLIDSVRDASQNLRMCSDALYATRGTEKIGPGQSSSIIVHLRRLSNSLEEIHSVLRMSKCTTLADKCSELQDYGLLLKIASTGGDFPSKPYTTRQKLEQEQNTRALKQMLHSLIFEINRFGE